MATSVKVITDEARLSYVHVFSPTVTPSGTKQYSVAVLIPKTDTETLGKIQSAIQQCESVLTSQLGRVPATGYKRPLRDGDVERPNDPAYAGHYFFNANCKLPAPVIGADYEPIISEQELYSGCYARVSVNFYPFSQAGNRGTGVGLNAIQKLRDGEPLSGTVVDAVAEFGGKPATAVPASPSEL